MKMEKLGHSEKTTVGKRGKRKSLPPAGRLLEHNGRTSSPEHPDRQRGNDKIDPARTHLNYDLAEPLRAELYAGKSAREIYAERYAADKERYEREKGQAMRKDAVTLIEWCITAPKDLPPEYHEQFFRESYEWFLNRYGKDRVIAANVHLDETTPHMHLDFMPFVDGRLCAKNLETPAKLKKVHPDLQKHLEKILGVPVNLLTGETENGDKSKAGLEAETLREENKILQEQNDAFSDEIAEKLKQIDILDWKIAEQQGQLSAVEQRKIERMKLAEKLSRRSQQYQDFEDSLRQRREQRDRGGKDK